MSDPAAPAASGEAPSPPDALGSARLALEQALRVAGAAVGLLGAELQLARSSALVLVWLGFALVFLGVGAWLGTSAAIAAGIYQWTGNVFYGIGSVAVANIVGIVVVVFAMRGCWRDLTLPRTRRMLKRIGTPENDE